MKIYDITMKSFKKYTIFDIGVFKLCLMVFGMIVTLLFYDMIKPYLTCLIITFILSYLYLIYLTFFKYRDK